MERVTNARMEFGRETLKPTYRVILGEVGESYAFYIAQKLGMPERILKNAVRAAYGKEALRNYWWEWEEPESSRKAVSPIRLAARAAKPAGSAKKHQSGDSVMVLPNKKIRIVCELANEKGVLRVQIAGARYGSIAKGEGCMRRGEELASGAQIAYEEFGRK